MFKRMKVKIKGIVPTILHNGQAADPLNSFAKKMKKYTSKRNKTDEDHYEMARIEWFSCLYVNDKGRIVWPADAIERMIIDAAKKTRCGTKAKSGLWIEGDAVIDYEGPKDPQKLWEYNSDISSNKFISRVSAVVNKNKVMRTRPIFRDWELSFVVCYDTDVFNKEEIIGFIKTGGKMVGLSDWRPRYGRFELVSHNEVD